MEKKKILMIILFAALSIGLMIGAYFAYDYLTEDTNGFEKPILLDDEENVALDYETAEKSTSAEDTSSEVQEEELGDYADFTVYNKDGAASALSDIVEKGKPVIINFWTTWCGYCKQEMPDFNEAYNEYKDDVEFMMIDICGGGQDDIDSAKAYVEDEGFDFPVYYDIDLSALSAYYTTGYPTTIIIDSNANVVYARSGALTKESLVSMIEQLI